MAHMANWYRSAFFPLDVQILLLMMLLHGGGVAAATGVAGGDEVAVAKQWQNFDNSWLLIKVSLSLSLNTY